ncbi:hypothetical protein FKM82_002694 [Ascaphus truei]
MWICPNTAQTMQCVYIYICMYDQRYKGSLYTPQQLTSPLPFFSRGGRKIKYQKNIPISPRGLHLPCRKMIQHSWKKEGRVTAE